MMNSIGKWMVQIHLVISTLALGWAASLYFEMVDWGWAIPRREGDYQLASQLDKRIVAHKSSLRQSERSYAPVKDAWAAVREVDEHFVQNNLWYDKELARLLSDPKGIEVREINFIDGRPELDTPGKLFGKPVYQKDPLPDIEKSYESYVKDFKKWEKIAREHDRDFATWQDRQKENSHAKIGEYNSDGVKIKRGLLDLRELEVDLQTQIRAEIRYLEPRELDFRKEADVYRERRELLEEDLLRVKKGFTE
jgi:hypothetical protein